ncbi:unnamed protein product [Cuscuta epithymum]|uniref:Uncharacterized protein n=1 Tax=Cuscuta epithymum TaxID=186058 RepID=A0AAV0CQG1_9ASTE|nr:unnamed protein product [Cuscuta epithymum]
MKVKILPSPCAIGHYEKNGMLLLLGHGMHRMKLVGYAEWPLMVAALTAKSPGMIAL